MLAAVVAATRSASDSNFVAAKENGSACYVVAATRSASDSNFVAAKENGSACYVVAATRSAFDSILRCREGEWFRLQWPWQLRSSVSHSDFVAAKENSSACSGRGSYDLPCLILILLQQRRIVPPAVVVATTRSASDSILRCRKGEWFCLQNTTTSRLQ